MPKKKTRAALFSKMKSTPPCGHFIKCKSSRLNFKTEEKCEHTLIWLWHFFYLWQTDVLEVLNLVWKPWLDIALWFNSVQVHHSSVTSDPTRWRLTTFLHPWQPNWSVSAPVTGSSHDNDQLSQCPGPLHVLPFFFCFFLTQNPSWPHSRTAQTVLLAHIKASVIPNLQCQSPYSFCLLHNHSRSPSHSAASNRKPAISNLTHFSDC